MNNRSREALDQLEAATLEELQSRYPTEWQAVGEKMVAATSTRRPEALAELVRKTTAAARPWRARLLRPRATVKDLAVALPHLASARLAKLAADQVLQAAAAQIATGKRGSSPAPGRVRLGLWSGFLIQRLMFKRGLERKPVSMAAFRLLWPVIPDRRLLMPLVQPKGIYCFYSQELIAALAQLVGERSCLEVGAGDGTLSRFLAAAGVAVRAVDDYSWAHAITYPSDVERVSAEVALERQRPGAVICSFPPPQNHFEQRIFSAPSVDLYVVITSRHRFAAGDWQAYERQRTFAWSPQPELSRLVLPPELDPEVLIFRRPSADGGEDRK